MTRRTASQLAWSLSGLAVAFGGSFLLLLVLNREVRSYDYWLADAIMQIVFPIVGALIVSRYPANALGWVFCFVGLSLAAGGFASQYATYALLTEPGVLPGGVMMAWLGAWLGDPGFFSLPFILLLFPNGRLPSSHWRPAAWFIVAAITTIVLAAAFMPGPLEHFPSIDNPVGIEAARALESIQPEMIFALLFSFFWLSSASSVILRFRRSQGIERQQLKWFTFAACLLPLSLIGNDVFPQLAWLIGGIAVSLIPISIGIAILRYRLYDIDLVINRTLVYGLLTGLLVLFYYGSVLGLQAVLRILTGQESEFAIVISTLGIAALFNPLRHRIQSFIDRRFFRRKYDAQETLAGFSAKLRNEVELDSLSDELLKVITDTMQPTHVSLWLRSVKQEVKP